ncbi:MAG: rhodanese-like domain-containing protein [Pseudomonadota bacterium]
MTLVRSLVLASIGFAAPAAAQEGFGPLVSPAELNAELGAPLILDIRGDAFAEGHIPGAVQASYGLFRGPAENPGQLVAEDHLEDVLGAVGLELDRPVVVVHQGDSITDFGAAARVYWTLKSSGVSSLSILNGGVNAWQEAGYDLSTDAVAPTPTVVDISFSDEWLATTDAVLEIVNGGDEALLLDARPESFWSGEQAHPAAARAGTLPQSEYFEHASWFDGGPAIIDPAAAQALAAERNFDGQSQIVSFCNTGHWAATNWFALSELAGVENVKLYPESLVGYSNAGHEMANTPGLLQNLINQISGG